jgi:hypothetical protein
VTHDDTVVIGAGRGGVGADVELLVAVLGHADERVARAIHRRTWEK